MHQFPKLPIEGILDCIDMVIVQWLCVTLIFKHASDGSVEGSKYHASNDHGHMHSVAVTMPPILYLVRYVILEVLSSRQRRY